jgi:hypothetical protein
MNNMDNNISTNIHPAIENTPADFIQNEIKIDNDTMSDYNLTIKNFLDKVRFYIVINPHRIKILY